MCLLCTSQEAQSRSALAVAQEAFSLMYADAVAAQQHRGAGKAGKAATQPGYAAQLLRLLIKTTAAKWNAADAAAAAAAAQGAGEGDAENRASFEQLPSQPPAPRAPDPGRHAELAARFSAAERQLLHGCGSPLLAARTPPTPPMISSFAGAPPGRRSELAWFACRAWDAALGAAVAPAWGHAAALFSSAATFLDAVDVDEKEEAARRGDYAPPPPPDAMPHEAGGGGSGGRLAAGGGDDARARRSPLPSPPPRPPPLPALPSRCVAWLLCAAAALEGDGTAAGGTGAPIDEVDRLEAASAALRRSEAASTDASPFESSGGGCAAAGLHPSSSRVHVYRSLLSLTVAVRGRDCDRALHILRAAEAGAPPTAPPLTLDCALKMALVCGGPAAPPPAALRSIEMTLRCAAAAAAAAAAGGGGSNGPSGDDYRHVARFTRKLIRLLEASWPQLAAGAAGGGMATAGADGREAKLLRAFREGAELMRAASPPGAWPPDEAVWLPTAAWNRGAALSRAGRGVDAVHPLLAVARLAAEAAHRHAPPAAEAMLRVMREHLAALGRRFAADNGW